MSWRSGDKLGLMRGPSERIVLAHGGGGQLTDELIATLFRPALDNPILARLDDAALLEGPPAGSRLAFTTDSYVVQPIEFPGGDIGRLAVCGTVNDLAVCGAEPVAISIAFVLEEGLELPVLKRVVESVRQAANEAGVPVVAGDTKVVGRGNADGMYLTSTGIGLVRTREPLAIERIRPGDHLLINGPIADHGLAVMLSRGGGEFICTGVLSDVAPLNDLVRPLLEELDGLVFMRDPTRGGLAGVLAELAERTGFRLSVQEAAIPLRPQTRYAAELLGLDPLEVANEGKVVVVVRPQQAERALELLRRHPLGRDAQLIGQFTESRDGICELITQVGGRRIVQKPYGEQLPRIC